jgi:DNA helicase-2/ATP-dependent DNA helicase PcrA
MSTTAPLEVDVNVHDDILDGLNDRQLEAVVHGEGPLLLLAGAGTGKTRVLARRLAWLIASKRARPSEILALTFTDKAAAEMEERVDVLVPYGFADVEISTFHAFGRRLLAEFALVLGLAGEPRLLDDAEALVFARERLFDLPLERLRPLADPTRHLQALLAAADRARDEGIAPAAWARWAAARAAAAAGDPAAREEAAEHAEVAAFYGAYLERLAQAGVADYGQLVWLALRLLEEHPRVRREVAGRYRYVLVDEFQDTNVAQFRMLRALCADRRNLTVVGDDDQSIYRFRGAAAGNLADFLDAFPDARQVVLVDNYRSTQPVLDAAYRLIRHNDPDRLESRLGIDKRLRATPARGGASPEFHWFDLASSEAEFVARRLREEVDAGRHFRDCAVLVRAHQSARPFLQTLSYRGIPYRYAGNRGLYDEEEVRTCLHLLAAVADPRDSVALYHLAASEVYEVPADDLAVLSGASRRRHEPLAETIDAALEPPEVDSLPPEARERLARMRRDLGWLRALSLRRPTGEVLYRFLERSGWLERLSAGEHPGDERRLQNLARLFERLRAFGEIAIEDRVVHFVRHVGFLRDAGDSPPVAEPDDEEDAVSILTVHRAKGIEFPVVFLVDLIEGRFPTPRRGAAIVFPEALRRDAGAERDAHLEEERRLFYVGMTRARETLVLTGARDRGGKRAARPSRFVLEALEADAAHATPSRTAALEALRRHLPDELPEPAAAAVPAGEPLTHSIDQLADYAACPLRYRFAHVARVPLLAHHAIVYGTAVRAAVRTAQRQRLDGVPVAIEDLWAAFDGAWQSAGFLSREHEEVRYETGRRVVAAFLAREERGGAPPHAVDRELRWTRGADTVRGRVDRIDLRREGPVLAAVKTAEARDRAQADERARDSVPLRLAALAYREQFGVAPVAVELDFVDSGIAGRHDLDSAAFAAAEETIAAAVAGIRARAFAATPSYAACGHCAYRDVCPSRFGT